MQLTIDIPVGTARKVEVVAGEIADRKRSGPQTRVIAAVMAAVAEALPGFFEAGDDVTDRASGERAVVDSFANGGSMAVIHDVDHGNWRVVSCDDLVSYHA